MLMRLYISVGGHVRGFQLRVLTHTAPLSAHPPATQRKTQPTLIDALAQLGSSEPPGVCSAFTHHFELGEVGLKGEKAGHQPSQGRRWLPGSEAAPGIRAGAEARAERGAASAGR